MKSLNLQIFSENEDFYNDIDWFMCKKSKEYEIIKKRILSINQIFDKSQSRDLKIEYFLGSDLDGKFNFQDLIGEPYVSREIDIISLSNVSHSIKTIHIDHTNFNYSADVVILNTADGNKLSLIPEEYLILRPVYLPQSKQITTFNIDISRKYFYNKILERKAA